jgi:hypothetical protein
MTKERVMLTFSEPVIREPVIYTLSQEFGLVTNIVRADLAEDSGWIIVELSGTKEDIERGISWATSKGIRVDPSGD